MSDTLLADITEALERDDLTDEQVDDLLAGLEAMLAAERDWTLQPRQQVAEDFLADLNPDHAHELLYGGAVGGGKSDFLLWHHYHLAIRYPGYRGLVLRRTFRELARTLIRRSFETFDRAEAKWNGVDKMWRFANGSTIEFGYLETEQDVFQYQSAEYDVISFDELTQWPNDFGYTYLFSRIRTRAHLTALGLVGHMVSGTNPGNVGGVWVKKRFIDEGAEMRQIEIADPTSDLITTRCFVPAKMGDNRHINKRQYRAMLTNLAPALRAQLEDGSWDVVEGMYFPEWERRIHTMSPFELPANWPRIRCLDYGYTNPMACYWIAFDQDGTGYVYRELYGTGMTPIIQARRILEMTPPREGIDYTVADPSIWTKTGVGPPIASQFRASGLNTRKANNARIDGWARLREFLRVDDALGRPKLYVFTTCQNLIRTLPMMVHDKKNPEDLDTRSEDHACLAADTLVLTQRGDVPIEHVERGDLVWTRRGFRPVSVSECTSIAAALWTVETSEGRLTGTYNHPVWTENRGWIGLSALTPSDTLLAWRTPESSPGPSSPTEASGTTSAIGTSSTRASAFTAACGLIAAVRSRLASMFTTTTRTEPTTRSATSVSSPEPSTSASTVEPPLPLGSPIVSDRFQFSSLATLDSPRPNARTRRSADGRRSSLWRSPAWSAAFDSTRRSLPERSSARVLAKPRRSGVGAVFNLCVAGRLPEYVAGGILVHNCDALRYGLMSRPRTIVTPRREAVTLEERIAESHRRKRGFESRLTHPELGRI